MKKLTLLSIFIVLIMVLSACSGGNNAAENTPGAEVTSNVPVTGETVVATTAVPTATKAAATTAATEAVVATESATSTAVTAQPDYPNLLSEIDKLEIVTQDCKELAEVDGVVVSRGDGNILYAVAVTGGAFTLDKEVLIPWQALDLHLNLDNEAGVASTVEPGIAATAQAAGTAVVGNCFTDKSGFVLNTPVENLSQAPSVLTSDNNDLNKIVVQKDWDKDLRAYWTNLGVKINQAVKGNDTNSTDNAQVTTDTVVIRDVGELNLRGPEDDQIGDIQDFVVNPEKGVVTHIVLSEGGFLGIGEHYILVPWQALGFKMDEDGKTVITLNADKNRIENAPFFKSLDELPDITTPNWDKDINSYWTTQS